MITIIDYDAGNLKSVEKALQYLGEDVIISRKREEILSADGVILPGVGAFGEAMKKLREYNLEEIIQEVVKNQTPFLGICLGLQLLFEGSNENPDIKGMEILEGEIAKIPDDKGVKVPHIGWNSLELTNSGRLFRGVKEQSYVYFVHSYYLKAKDEKIVKASTDYAAHIHASIEKDNVFACQFHPEKSGDVGLKILKNFAEIAGGRS